MIDARQCCFSPSNALDHLLQGEGDGLDRLRQVLQQSVNTAADVEKTKEQLLEVQQQLAAAHHEAARLHVSNISSEPAAFSLKRASAQGLMSMIWVPTYPGNTACATTYFRVLPPPLSSWPSSFLPLLLPALLWGSLLCPLPFRNLWSES